MLRRLERLTMDGESRAVELGVAEAEEAALLQRPPGTPVLVVTTQFAAGGRLAALAVSTYRADTCRLTFGETGLVEVRRRRRSVPPPELLRAGRGPVPAAAGTGPRPFSGAVRPRVRAASAAHRRAQAELARGVQVGAHRRQLAADRGDRVLAQRQPQLVTCTIVPLRWARRCGSTRRVSRSAPKNITSIAARSSSSLVSSMEPTCPYPALLTSTSIRPCASIGALHRLRALLGIGHVQSHRRDPPRELGRQRIDALRPSHGGDHDVAAVSAARAKAAPSPLLAPVISQRRARSVF